MTDAVDTHLAALAAALRGPSRMRRSMLAETRDGLRDAADAHQARGACAAVAAERAVHDFGTVPDLAPLYQAELTASQGRRTALLLALVFPALTLGWDVVWRSGAALPSAPGVVVLNHGLDVAGWLAAALAVALLGATVARRVDPRVLATAVAVTGLLAAVVTVTTAVAMNVVNATAAARMLAVNPLMLPALVISALAMIAVVRSTTCALRAARHR